MVLILLFVINLLSIKALKNASHSKRIGDEKDSSGSGEDDFNFSIFIMIFFASFVFVPTAKTTGKFDLLANTLTDYYNSIILFSLLSVFMFIRPLFNHFTFRKKSNGYNTSYHTLFKIAYAITRSLFSSLITFLAIISLYFFEVLYDFNPIVVAIFSVVSIFSLLLDMFLAVRRQRAEFEHQQNVMVGY